MKRVVRGLMIIASVMLPLSAHADLSELIAQANQGDRNAQYQLAIDYQSGQNTPVSQDDAFYWFQQAAESGHPAAMIQLANTYLSGSGTEKDIDKALFWLTKAFATGNQDAAIQIGQLYESLNRSPASQTMAEIWYHTVADSNPKAEQLYTQLLEQKFNQQRARQVSSIEQLESTIDQSAASQEPTATTTSHTQNQTESLMSDYLFIILFVLVIVALLSVYRYVKQARQQQSTQEQEKLTTQLNEQSGVVKQQKRQLDKLYRELKKLQSTQATQNQDHKLALACAMFGFHPSQLPDERNVKIRYKQLSKIYHPDMKGSEEEMKRLNGALKIIISYVNK
ncbi:J domain-containing protein [Vibrio fluvialis]|uniref:J domain-containing protein n=1 Tax=Vibrio fluvialis TaxID=676 RepID=UPI001558A708|nr:J domain-containing protein [Vibrio fluvialis]MBY7824833.1 J domain-containing protein [Vibrio fluvialis]MBY7984082.1 J domain-containing protein [Vibrio fluvialis]MBY8157833.1 J domain-containing protein [Vibrio fluvialis]QKE34027.1 J domain-containing protein [Vibrio fluvialis]